MNDKFTEDFIKEQLYVMEKFEKAVSPEYIAGRNAATQNYAEALQIISKQRLKIERQKDNISKLLHLYTSGKRSKSHKKLREKYRALKAAYQSLKGSN